MPETHTETRHDASEDGAETETASVEVWYDHESMFEMDEYPEPDETIEMAIQDTNRRLLHSPKRGADTHLVSENPDALMERYHFRVQTERPVKLLVHQCRSNYDEWNDPPVESGLRYKQKWSDERPFGCKLNGRVILNLVEWDGER